MKHVVGILSFKGKGEAAYGLDTTLTYIIGRSSKHFVRMFTKKSSNPELEEIKRYPNWETVIDTNVL